jgi:two-component system sensor histidine kinase/response regulator
MLELIKNLLEVYRYDAGATPLNWGPVDLRELINACIAINLFSCISVKSYNLCASFEDGEPHRIVGDRIALQRVILNLLSNAIKFSIEGAEGVLFQPVFAAIRIALK